MRHSITLLAAVAFSMAAGPLLAIDPDQIRGEVVSADEDSRELRLQVLESGDERAAREGQVETFVIPEDAEIEYQIDRMVYTTSRMGDVTLDDLEEGDRVLVEFEEVAGRKEGRTVRAEETANVEARERVRRTGRQVGTVEDDDSDQFVAATSGSERSRLPSTASVLPAMALIGAAFGLVGAGLAVRRRRDRR